jgi:hypothetical protein
MIHKVEFEIELISRAAEYDDVIVRSLTAEGLPAQSPSFMTDVVHAVEEKLEFKPQRVRVDPGQTTGLREVHARAFRRNK